MLGGLIGMLFVFVLLLIGLALKLPLTKPKKRWRDPIQEAYESFKDGEFATRTPEYLDNKNEEK